MYRFVLLFFLFTVAECHRRCHGSRVSNENCRLNRHNDRHYEKIFEKVSRSTIAAERELRQSCNVVSPIHEVFGPEFYVLKYNLPEFIDGDISIRIKHRVMYFKAAKWDGLTFRDIRLLPQMVNTPDARWFIEDGEVKVLFTYKNELGKDTMKFCSEVIIEKVLIVPNTTADLIDLKSGDFSSSPQLENVTFSASV